MGLMMRLAAEGGTGGLGLALQSLAGLTDDGARHQLAERQRRQLVAVESPQAAPPRPGDARLPRGRTVVVRPVARVSPPRPPSSAAAPA